jgi:hypothetical protein
LYLYLTSDDILRAFQKNKFYYEFNPFKGEVADIVPSNSLTRCAPGESYETGPCSVTMTGKEERDK